MKNEITLQQVFDKVDEALPHGGWGLRRTHTAPDSPWKWRAFTRYGEEEVQGGGATVGEALICFLVKVLEYEQGRGVEHEDTARNTRDRIARLQRAIESL